MKKIVTTSWDDGYEQSVEVASLLKEYGLAGTFYIPINFPENNSLEDDEIVDISEDFEIGAHGVAHIPLTEFTKEEKEIEVKNSKNILQRIIGQEVCGFAYPQGKFDKESVDIVEKYFDYARTTIEGRFDIPNKYKMPVTVFCGSHFIQKLKFSFMSLYDDMYTFGGGWRDTILQAYRKMIDDDGILHIVGHPQDWSVKYEEKLREIFSKISNDREVEYMTNREVIESLKSA